MASLLLLVLPTELPYADNNLWRFRETGYIQRDIVSPLDDRYLTFNANVNELCIAINLFSIAPHSETHYNS